MFAGTCYRSFMGGSPYWYFVEFKDNVEDTLSNLRKREFEAGRYEPAMSVFGGDNKLRLQFPIDLKAASPGAQHASERHALEASMEGGTQSILDITKVSAEPVAAGDPGDPMAMFGRGGRSFQTSYPIEPELLRAAFGTEQPTRGVVERVLFHHENEAAAAIWNIPRGSAIHLLTYEGSKPTEALFLGISFD